MARRAGVSPITASRALRASTLVAPSTRSRVEAAAAELGYVPNLLARGLVQDRTATLGVVILELANPFFAPMVSGIETVAGRHGYLAIVGESGRDAAGERRYVERFQQLRVGGIVLTTATPRMDHLAAARAQGTPVVVMARRWPGGDYVTADNREGGRIAARHLLERGHRRIALICPDDAQNTAMQDRVRGFGEVLAQAGASLGAGRRICTPDTLLEDGWKAAEELLGMADRPTAVFVATDRQAMGVVHRLVEAGVRIPEEIAVVGFDDLPWASCSRVPLTTVAIPMRRIGELAAEILFSRLEGAPGGKRQIRLRPELIVRASSR